MEKERIKDFAKDILRQAEEKGLSEEEMVCLPRVLEWEINDSVVRDRQKRTFKYNDGLDAEVTEKSVAYLCDGEAENCGKRYCYKNGGECEHTPDIQHARNFHKPYPRSAFREKETVSENQEQDKDYLQLAKKYTDEKIKQQEELFLQQTMATHELKMGCSRRSLLAIFFSSINLILWIVTIIAVSVIGLIEW